jgi:hypothetical protein
LGYDCPYNIFTKDFLLGIAVELLGEFIEESYSAVFVHTQNNTGDILYKLAVFIFANMQPLFGTPKLCGYLF